MTAAAESATPGIDRRREAGHWLVVAAVVIVHGGLLAYSAAIHSPVWDELGHLPAGMIHWKAGVFDLYRVNPPLVRMWATTIPAVRDLRPADTEERIYSSADARAEFPSGSAWIRAAPESFLESLRLARWTCIPLSMLGALACHQLAGELFGRRAALAAVLLWCSSPMILGHGALMTPDVGSASFAALAMLAVWRWGECGSWLSATLAGGAIGLAWLTKFTNLFLAPCVLAAAWLSGRRATADDSPGRRAGQLVWIGVIALDVINATYLFEGTGTALGDFPFVSATFRGSSEDGRSGGNRFAGTWAARIPVPLPANYVQGIDVQRREFEGRLLSYLRGEWRSTGWYHYYLYAFLVKEPLGTLLLIGGGLGLLAASRAFWASSVFLYAVLPAAVFFVALSLQTGFNHHLRYLLPAYPFLYVIASAPFGRSSPGGLKWAASACLAASVMGSLSVYPHSLSYFNAIAGGPTAGPRHLHNSNVDWGQDLLLLSDWADRHPDCRPLRVVYSNGYRSEDLPLWGRNVVHGDLTAAEWRALQAGRLEPTWYAISTGRLYDPPLSDPKYRFFRESTPTAMVGYSIYLYQISPSSPVNVAAAESRGP